MKKTRTGCLPLWTAVFLLTGCATNISTPTAIGGGNYYLAATNYAGAFGSVTTVAQHLMQKGSRFCAANGLQKYLIKTNLRQRTVGLGSASIRFRCVSRSVANQRATAGSASGTTTKR